MLISKIAALLCTGVLVSSALKLAASSGPYAEGSAQSMYDSSHAQQNPLHGSELFDQKSAEEVFEGNLESELEALSVKTAESRTIYQVLSDSPNFSRLVKIINISDEIVSLLNDTSAGITFFAPTNKALRPPRHRKPHDGFISLVMRDPAVAPNDVYSVDLSEIISEIEELQPLLAGDLENDPDKERCKKFIKILIRAILAYHILPQGLDAAQLVRNTTYATNLTIPDGALDEEPLRISVTASKLFPVIKINVLTTVIKPDTGALNGIIHVINHPLLPPPSIFQELFLFPYYFGTVTSALQRVGLTDDLEWRYVCKEGNDKKWTVQGTGSTTAFIPSNAAFNKLPKKLQLFLFSPFGEKILKKLLKFHIVPGIVLHSDYLHNATSSETITADAWFNCGSAEVDYTDEKLFTYSGDKDDLHSIFYHKGSHAPPGFRHSHSHGSEYHEDCQHNLDVTQVSGASYKYHSLLDPSSCRENHCHPPPPPPPPPQDFRVYEYAPVQDNNPSHKHFTSRPDRVFIANLTLPTLLTNHSLHIHIAKYKVHLPIPGHSRDIYITGFVVNGQRVAFADVVARNGAVHVLNKVLNPRPPHHQPHKPHKPAVADGSSEVYEDDVDDDDDGWADWEDWLPQWAAEN